MAGLHADRARASSFGSVAVDYDRFRPSYPAALIDDLLKLAPETTLDVGCGTGKAAVLLAERGVDVLGVEPDARMAAVARSHGIAVEAATFEAWDPAGRRFDLITCGQAWHWVDPAIGIPKAATLLTPAGTLALFWNYDEIDLPAHDALEAVYAEFAPELAQTVTLGGSRQSEEPHAAKLRDSGLFRSVETRDYQWAITRSAREWVAMTATHSDHLQLDPPRRMLLLEAIGDAIDACGGTVTSEYVTYTVFAHPLIE